MRVPRCAILTAVRNVSSDVHVFHQDNTPVRHVLETVAPLTRETPPNSSDLSLRDCSRSGNHTAECSPDACTRRRQAEAGFDGRLGWSAVDAMAPRSLYVRQSLWTTPSDVFTYVQTFERTWLQVTDKAFSIAGPRAWNALPSDMKLISSCTSFRKKLKTHFFSPIQSKTVLVFSVLLLVLFTVTD